MQKVIDKTYLPFSSDELRPHFTTDVEGQLNYYQKSARRYHDFLEKNPKTSGISLSDSKLPRQIEKDERFWTITATKSVFDATNKEQILNQLLTKTYGPTPPISGISSWEECLDGELHLYFEACLPSPSSYVDWLRSNITNRQLIPYILDGAARKNARTLEGATHVDAMFLNVTNGFAWLIEAKVLSDISYSISFDNLRNQIARNIDVMLDKTSHQYKALEKRNPVRSLFALLSPKQFKNSPHSRLYGWLMTEYITKPDALARDLCHLSRNDWPNISRRIGWITFEDVNEVLPNSCSWL